MTSLLDEPSVVLVCVTIATALLVVEVALPTLGVAGTVGAAAGVGAVVGIAREDMTWWPLGGPAIALAVWTGLIVARRRSPPGELVAAGAFAAGGVGFAVLNEDAVSGVLTVVATAALFLAFPRAQRAADRLWDRPSTAGMDGLVGKAATVDRWEPGACVVYLDGTRWNADAGPDSHLAAGDAVTVVGYHGSTVEVRPVLAAPPAAPPLAPRS